MFNKKLFDFFDAIDFAIKKKWFSEDYDYKL